MSEVKDWSVDARENSSLPPDGFPEGMSSSSFIESGREVMAACAKTFTDQDSFSFYEEVQADVQSSPLSTGVEVVEFQWSNRGYDGKIPDFVDFYFPEGGVKYQLTQLDGNQDPTQLTCFVLSDKLVIYAGAGFPRPKGGLGFVNKDGVLADTNGNDGIDLNGIYARVGFK